LKNKSENVVFILSGEEKIDWWKKIAKPGVKQVLQSFLHLFKTGTDFQNP
jgi:6-phosphogluconolactonase/glucosamine-6-phosphate isomerase/deaminase